MAVPLRRSASLSVDVVTPAPVRAPSLARWLRSVAPSNVRGRVTVALVSDHRIRVLNRKFRGVDRVTDVLSFPAEEPSAPGRARRIGGPRNLGDIVIGAGIARRQAGSAGHSLQTELRVLALHGLLHLLGYDHERDDGRMARLESRLRRRGGLREGLIERQR
jgi:probable rRNA maturation factor